MTDTGAWRVHPSGISSRALPDGWPALDLDHGFRPTFAVYRMDLGQYEMVDVFPTLLQAARFASLCHRNRCRGQNIKINDQNCTNL